MNNICRPYTQEEVFYLDTNSENNLDTRGVPIIGLTSEEVRERIDKGLTNHTDISTYILQSYIPHTYGAAMYRWFI